MSERRLEAVVIGPGVSGGIAVVIGRTPHEFVVNVPTEDLPPDLRRPNSQFVAVVEGRTLVRVEPEGQSWMEIQDRIRRVLNQDWDPIGVADAVDDEYDGYIGVIYSILRSGAAENAIANHLRSIEVEGMGLKGTPVDKLLAVAVKLRALQLPALRR